MKNKEHWKYNSCWNILLNKNIKQAKSNPEKVTGEIWKIRILKFKSGMKIKCLMQLE